MLGRITCVLLLVVVLSAACQPNPPDEKLLTPTPTRAFTPSPPATSSPRSPTLTPTGAPTSAPPSPTPTKPSNAALQLTAKAQDTIIKLSWSPVAVARGYFIYRDQGEAPLNLDPLPGTTFEDLGLTNGKTYLYMVTAVDAGHQVIARSNEIRAVPGR